MTFTKRELEILSMNNEHAGLELLYEIRKIIIGEFIPEELLSIVEMNQKLIKEMDVITEKLDLMRQEIDSEDLK